MRATDSCGNRRASCAACAILAACGCGVAPPLMETAATALVWPSGGEPARVTYIGSIGGESDVAPPSFLRSLVDGMFGAEAPRAFGSPLAVAVSSAGIVCVADGDARGVHRIDLAAREYDLWREAGDGVSFHTPTGVTFAGDSVAVADRGLGLVVILASDGTPRGTIGDIDLEAPVGVAVGPRTGTIFVTDVGMHALKAFAPDGRLLFTVGRRGTGDGEFNYPTFVACDADERIYVSDALNARVQVFDSRGRFAARVGGQGDSPGSFAHPKGIAVDKEGVLYVVDARFENVQMFDRRGRLLMAFGGEGTGPGQFWLPAGMCADDRGRLWIADSCNHRVQVFRALSAAEEGAGR